MCEAVAGAEEIALAVTRIRKVQLSWRSDFVSLCSHIRPCKVVRLFTQH